MCNARNCVLPCAFGEGDTVCVCLVRSDDVRQLVVLQEVIDGSRTKAAVTDTETDTCM
jgi:hypothetical protein